jgi:hypothetical protein
MHSHTWPASTHHSRRASHVTSRPPTRSAAGQRGRHHAVNARQTAAGVAYRISGWTVAARSASARSNPPQSGGVNRTTS